MKWFQHQTATRRDERIAAYLDDPDVRSVPEAAGFWWMVLETIADQMDTTKPKCLVRYSLATWSRTLQ